MDKLLVKDAYHLHGTDALILSRDSTLEELITRLASEPGIRGVFLVDESGCFAGTVSRAAIMKWAEFQLFNKWKGNAVALDVLDMIQKVKARSLVRGDAQSLGVLETDPLHKAFDQMMSYGEDVIPVLDKDRKVIGDLRLSEILMKVIETSRDYRKQ